MRLNHTITCGLVLVLGALQIKTSKTWLKLWSCINRMNSNKLLIVKKSSVTKGDGRHWFLLYVWPDLVSPMHITKHMNGQILVASNPSNGWLWFNFLCEFENVAAGNTNTLTLASAFVNAFWVLSIMAINSMTMTIATSAGCVPFWNSMPNRQ